MIAHVMNFVYLGCAKAKPKNPVKSHVGFQSRDKLHMQDLPTREVKLYVDWTAGNHVMSKMRNVVVLSYDFLLYCPLRFPLYLALESVTLDLLGGYAPAAMAYPECLNQMSFCPLFPDCQVTKRLDYGNLSNGPS